MKYSQDISSLPKSLEQVSWRKSADLDVSKLSWRKSVHLDVSNIFILKVVHVKVFSPAKGHLKLFHLELLLYIFHLSKFVSVYHLTYLDFLTVEKDFEKEEMGKPRSSLYTSKVQGS